MEKKKKFGVWDSICLFILIINLFPFGLGFLEGFRTGNYTLLFGFIILLGFNIWGIIKYANRYTKELLFSGKETKKKRVWQHIDETPVSEIDTVNRNKEDEDKNVPLVLVKENSKWKIKDLNLDKIFKFILVVAILLAVFSLVYRFVILQILNKRSLENCLSVAKETYEEKWAVRCREHNRPIGQNRLCEDLPDYAGGDQINQNYTEAKNFCFKKYPQN
ncbi:MAG: hypothetical protein Q7R75_02790 [bacterium]|nr:hypothetical protein [bacterium]